MNEANQAQHLGLDLNLWKSGVAVDWEEDWGGGGFEWALDSGMEFGPWQA